MPAAGRSVLRGNVLMVASTLCWATAFPATTILLETWHPLLVACARIGGGALVLLAWAAASGAIPQLGRLPWMAIVGLGIVGFAGGAGLIVAGQALSGPVTAAVLATSMPLISALMGLAEGSERMTLRLGLGIALAVGGGTLATLAVAQGQFSLGGGELLVLASQGCWAWFSRRAMTAFPGLNPVTRAALPMAAGALFLMLLAVVLAGAGIIEPRARLDWQSLLLIVWVATAGIGFSVTLWLMATRILGVTIASMHLNLGPFYVMLILVALGGTVVLGQVLGAVLVAAGAIIAQLGRRQQPVLPAVDENCR